MTVPCEEVKDTQRITKLGGEATTVIRICSGGKKKKACANEPHRHRANVLYSNRLTFSEAVASLVPLASKARAANGLSWAGIILAARWKTHTQTLVRDALQKDKRTVRISCD